MGKAPSGSFPESVYASAGDKLAINAFRKLFTSSPCKRTGVADTCVVDLDADLALLRGLDLNLLDAQVLAGLPGDSGLRTVSCMPSTAQYNPCSTRCACIPASLFQNTPLCCHDVAEEARRLCGPALQTPQPDSRPTGDGDWKKLAGLDSRWRRRVGECNGTHLARNSLRDVSIASAIPPNSEGRHRTFPTVSAGIVRACVCVVREFVYRGFVESKLMIEEGEGEKSRPGRRKFDNKGHAAP